MCICLTQECTCNQFTRHTLDRTLGLPTMMIPYLALVRATLRRLGSFRNPIPWCSLALTHERIMKSFSLPWKASTLATSISYKHDTTHTVKLSNQTTSINQSLTCQAVIDLSVDKRHLLYTYYSSWQQGKGWKAFIHYSITTFKKYMYRVQCSPHTVY